jgi:hypothetical protein
MYGASWPLYFDFPNDLLISTITVQLCMILTASLDQKQILIQGQVRGWTVRPPVTVAVGYTFLYLMPLMTGDIPDPDGGVALDSPWQLREASVRHVTGDPGRLLMEWRTEHRMATNTGFLVPFQQVEFFDQQQGIRDACYVPCPPWWEVWYSNPRARQRGG